MSCFMADDGVAAFLAAFIAFMALGSMAAVGALNFFAAMTVRAMMQDVGKEACETFDISTSKWFAHEGRGEGVCVCARVCVRRWIPACL